MTTPASEIPNGSATEPNGSKLSHTNRGGNPMRTITALALAGLLAGCAANVDSTTTSSVPEKASSVVRVNLKDGHGSGVYIGNGIVLTAGHVGVGQDVVNLLLDNGKLQAATVLWVNTTYDIAAIRVSLPERIKASPLSCATPKIGAKVTAAGSPGYDDFVYLGGNVAGKVRKKGKWQEVIPVPVAGGAQGISGGPLFDEYGQVVGIVAAMCVTGVIINEGGWKERIALAGIGALAFGMALL